MRNRNHFTLFSPPSAVGLLRHSGKMNRFKVVVFLLLSLQQYSFVSLSDVDKSSERKLLYDYWTTLVDDGRIGEYDIYEVIELFGKLRNTTMEKAYATSIETSSAVDSIGQRFLEMVGLMNSTKLECQKEIKSVLSSMAILSYEYAVPCNLFDRSKNEKETCAQRKRKRIGENVWAAKLLNSWGSSTSGLLVQGQFLWFGSYHQCVKSIVLDGRSARYCTISIGPTFEKWAAVPPKDDDAPSIRAQLGACLPPSCVEDNDSELLNAIMAYLSAASSGISHVEPRISKALTEYYVHCPPVDHQPLTSGQVAVIVLLVLLAILVVVGTIIECYLRIRAAKRRDEKNMQRMLKGFGGESIVETTNDTTDWIESIKKCFDLESVISFKSQTSLRRSIRRLTWWLHLVTAFSVHLNIRWLVSSQSATTNGERGGNRITCLYGMRVLTMMWVILGHTYVFAMPHLSNLVEAAERIPSQFLSQLILNSSLSVDTFFLISGLLNSYMWCLRQKKEDRTNRCGSWLAYYGHRYFRLVPPYLLVIAVVTSGLFASMGHGPHWNPPMISGVQCDANTWWRHLFFVNNLVPGGEHCLPWMWHLAIDVQCYAIAPLFIIVLWKYPKFGYALILSVVLMSALARGLVIGLMRLPTNMMLFLPNDNYRNDYHTGFDMVYQKPYFRCGPYLIGLLTGYMLATKTDELRMWHRADWKRKSVVWIFIVIFCVWPLFGLYPMLCKDLFSTAYNGIYAAVNRTTFSIGVAMIIVSCHCNFGCSYLNDVLSWIGWWPFARLNYGVYLVHELLMVFVYYNLRSAITYDGHVSLLAYFALFTAASYALALVMFTMAEGPALAAERLLFRRKPGSHKKRKGKPLETVEVEPMDLDRQRMTERWSNGLGNGSSPSGIELYTAADCSSEIVHIFDDDVSRTAVETGFETDGKVDTSVEASISESVTLGTSVGGTSVTMKATSSHLSK